MGIREDQQELVVYFVNLAHEDEEGDGDGDSYDDLYRENFDEDNAENRDDFDTEPVPE